MQLSSVMKLQSCLIDRSTSSICLLPLPFCLASREGLLWAYGTLPLLLFAAVLSKLVGRSTCGPSSSGVSSRVVGAKPLYGFCRPPYCPARRSRDLGGG